MHILLSILSSLIVIAILIIRLNNTARALHEVGDGVSGGFARLRRMIFRRQATRHPLSQINDPREATLALMVAVMKDRSDLSEQQLDDLNVWAEERLHYSNPEEMVTLARWHVKDFVESGAVLHRLGKQMASSCNGSQRADIIDLVEKAAFTRHETPTQLQAHTIEQLKYRFGDVTQQTYNQS